MPDGGDTKNNLSEQEMARHFCSSCFSQVRPPATFFLRTITWMNSSLTSRLAGSTNLLVEEKRPSYSSSTPGGQTTVLSNSTSLFLPSISALRSLISRARHSIFSYPALNLVLGASVEATKSANSNLYLGTRCTGSNKYPRRLS